MIKARAYLFYVILAALFIGANCEGPKSTVSNNENFYKKINHELDSKFMVYHFNDSVSQLFFSLPNENLIYKRPDTTAWYYTQVRVKYIIHPADKPRQILDSGSICIYDRQSEKVNAKTLSGFVSMKVRSGQVYIGDVSITDLNKKVKNNKVIEIDKTSTSSRQNFLLKNKDGEIIFDYYFYPTSLIYVWSERNSQDGIRVDYFNRDFPIARPTYSMVERIPFKYQPDSTFILRKTYFSYEITIPEKGFFHLITNNESKEGLTLFSVAAGFPGLTTETEMIKSTNYIMDRNEFENCMNAVDKKEAIDYFWKEIGGSNERAVELLKKYYKRVSQANKLFTSYVAGWKSDRGMIYIVFGAPSNVYKSTSGEQWIYGNEAQGDAIRFNFQKIINPFSDNDFTLERSEYYKAPWHIAVTYWREGRIYLDN